eukprot:jgi/Mesvir1/29719/Mv00950-RA.1
MSFQDLGKGGMGPGGAAVDKTSQELASIIFQMTTNTGQYRKLVSQIGTIKDTLKMREKLKELGDKIGILAKDASEKLQGTMGPEDADRLGHAKLLKNFRSVLAEFQQAQRTCVARESSFLPHADPGTLLAVDSSGGGSERQALLQQQQEDVASRIQLQNDIDFHEAIINERDAGIREVQQQIGQVNEIFKDLAVLINEQGQQLDDIEANIMRTHASTESAHRELTRAANSQKSNSKLVGAGAWPSPYPLIASIILV